MEKEFNNKVSTNLKFLAEKIHKGIRNHKIENDQDRVEQFAKDMAMINEKIAELNSDIDQMFAEVV